MKRFVNGIEDHRWVDFCQDIIEQRDSKKYNKDCNFGDSISEYGEFYNKYGGSTIHLRAEEISSGVLFEIRLLLINLLILHFFLKNCYTFYSLLFFLIS